MPILLICMKDGSAGLIECHLSNALLYPQVNSMTSSFLLGLNDVGQVIINFDQDRVFDLGGVWRSLDF